MTFWRLFAQLIISVVTVIAVLIAGRYSSRSLPRRREATSHSKKWGWRLRSTEGTFAARWKRCVMPGSCRKFQCGRSSLIIKIAAMSMIILDRCCSKVAMMLAASQFRCHYYAVHSNAIAPCSCIVGSRRACWVPGCWRRSDQVATMFRVLFAAGRFWATLTSSYCYCCLLWLEAGLHQSSFAAGQ